MSTYTSIHDLPISKWLKIHETRALSHLIIKGEYTKEELEAIWIKIREEHLQEFGLTANYKQFLELQRMQVYAQCDYGLNPTPINKTRVQIADKNMEDFLKESEGFKFSDSVTAIEKQMGFPMNVEKTTVYDFYRRAKFVSEQK